MIPLPRFDYARPKNLKEAICILSEAGRDARVLAGGTDLLVQMKQGLLHPSLLIDIKSIPHFSKISLDPKGQWVVGASVTLEELEAWARSQKHGFGLSQAAGSISSEQVKNRGTVVGNICRASPAGDMAPVLIAMDGKVDIHGPKGKRSVSVERFIIGPGQTALAKGEMVASLRIPKPQGTSAVTYLKLGARRAMETAIVAVAVRITCDKKFKKILSAKIVLGAVAPVPLRVPDAEEILITHGVEPDVLDQISSLARDRAKPITDLRGTERYRSEMVKVLTRRAVEKVWKGLTQGGWVQ